MLFTPLLRLSHKFPKAVVESSDAGRRLHASSLLFAVESLRTIVSLVLIPTESISMSYSVIVLSQSVKSSRNSERAPQLVSSWPA